MVTMSLTFLTNGLLTTLQDLGRHGARRYGINPGGAMDARAVRLINILLGNDENEAALEMHFPAPQVRFDKETVFALGGAEFGAALNDTPIDNWKLHLAREGDVLKFVQKRSGARCYLSVAGGFKIEEWLGSASTNLKAQVGGFEGRAIKREDSLELRKKGKEGNEEVAHSPLTTHRSPFDFRISHSLIPRYSKFPTARVMPGAEFELLDEESKRSLTTQHFDIGLQSDRMGFRLEGKPLRLEKPREFISSAVNFGTIQLLPDGQLIVLMADHQTTGGYPRLGHIVTHDLPLAGQLGARDGIGFHTILVKEAEALLLNFEKEIRLFKAGIRLRG